jgi:hypothetical protein
MHSVGHANGVSSERAVVAALPTATPEIVVRTVIRPVVHTVIKTVPVVRTRVVTKTVEVLVAAPTVVLATVTQLAEGQAPGEGDWTVSVTGGQGYDIPCEFTVIQRGVRQSSSINVTPSQPLHFGSANLIFIECAPGRDDRTGQYLSYTLSLRSGQTVVRSVSSDEYGIAVIGQPPGL